jgi:hypothetical protein
MRDIWLLRLRAPLARADGDDTAYNGLAGSLPRHGENPWLRSAYRLGRGNAMMAFAPVVLVWASDIDGEQKRVLERANVNGGAIAIGHPLGASGARIMTTLVNALEQRGGRYGLQTMCEGGGMANATIIDRLG